MMISPDDFIDQHSNKSYAELLAVRDELLNDIFAFEKHAYKTEELLTHPLPEVVYQCNLEYLGKLCELLSKKYNQEYIMEEVNCLLLTGRLILFIMNSTTFNAPPWCCPTASYSTRTTRTPRSTMCWGGSRNCWRVAGTPESNRPRRIGVHYDEGKFLVYHLSYPCLR